MRKAFITGASGGVGLEVARQLSDAGWQVIAHYRTQPREIDGVTWWQADLCAAYELPEIRELDALVHCAGVATLGRVSKAPQ